MTRQRKRSGRSALMAAFGALALGLGTLVAGALPAQAADAESSRLGGSDRYSTSAVMSRSTFQPGVEIAFLVSGEAFPDALAVGSSAGHIKSPILLTRQSTLPGSIAAELDRLNPQEIVIVGGTAAVSADVATAAREYSPKVTRIAGADRYETAARVSLTYFPEARVQSTWVVSGVDFPDALSASAAAANMASPLFLTDPQYLPEATDAALYEYLQDRVIVAGGTSAVDAPTAQAAFDHFFQYYTRVAGADRFETSAEISKWAFGPGTRTVYLASGTSFPDALSGAAVAGANGGPVLLVSGNQVSQSVCNEIYRLQPEKVVALGGTAAVSNAVLDHATDVCAKSRPTPTPTPDPGPAPGPSPTPTPAYPVPGGDTPPAKGSVTCDSFQTQAQAQIYYDYWLGKGYSDYFDLDHNDNGVACRHLP